MIKILTFVQFIKFEGFPFKIFYYYTDLIFGCGEGDETCGALDLRSFRPAEL